MKNDILNYEQNLQKFVVPNGSFDNRFVDTVLAVLNFFPSRFKRLGIEMWCNDTFFEKFAPKIATN